MATDVTISNRALQLAMARATITALNDGSNEANQLTLLYTPLLNWCLRANNWNFARKTAVLTLTKTAPGAPVTWSATYPAPPWKYEYAYPPDCLRAQYLTDMTVANSKWVGQPGKFQVASNAAGTGVVVLTDKVDALLNYTMNLTTVDLWDPLFQETFVAILAYHLASVLSGDAQLMKALHEIATQNMNLAVIANMREGLVPDDTTPEWILARGIPIPERRPLPSAATPARKDQNG